jgi:hypothetical protein
MENLAVTLISAIVTAVRNPQERKLSPGQERELSPGQERELSPGPNALESLSHRVQSGRAMAAGATCSSQLT